MPFEMMPGRFVLTDTDGRVAFDTNYRSLHQLGYFSGSFVIPQRSCIGTELDVAATYSIGSVSPFANMLMGSFYVTRIGTFPTGVFEVVPLGVWLPVGGTVDLTLGRGQTFLTSGVVQTGGADGSDLVGVQQLTFEIIGSSVVATERAKYVLTRTAGLQQTTFGGSASYQIDYHVFAMACDL